MDALDYRGLYLFAGPVGSGKTTLMHELVQERFKGQQVISIEDPVEIKQDNVLQLQVNQAIDMTYDNLIKGGGVIDFASENFQSHSSTSWNQQLEGLVEQGYLTEGDIQGEKIKD